MTNLCSGQIATKPRNYFFVFGKFIQSFSVCSPLHKTRTIVGGVLKNPKNITTCINDRSVILNQSLIINGAHSIDQIRKHFSLIRSFRCFDRWISYESQYGNDYNDSTIYGRTRNASKNKRAKKELKENKQFIQSIVKFISVTLKAICLPDFKFGFVAFHLFPQFIYLFLAVLVLVWLVESLFYYRVIHSYERFLVGCYLVAFLVYWLFGRASSNRSSSLGLELQNQVLFREVQHG